MPDTTPYIPTAIIGSNLPRIDGPLKTTGIAQYAADYHFPRLVHGVPVTSTIASGTIKSIDASAAEKMPGVVLILDHQNIGPLYRVAPGGHGGRTSKPARPHRHHHRLLGSVRSPRPRRNPRTGHRRGSSRQSHLRCHSPQCQHQARRPPDRQTPAPHRIQTRRRRSRFRQYSYPDRRNLRYPL